VKRFDGVRTVNSVTTNATGDDSLEKLRAITRGPKGDRPDYVGVVSTLDATVIVTELDALRHRLAMVGEHVAAMTNKGCCGWHREKLKAILGPLGEPESGRTESPKTASPSIPEPSEEAITAGVTFGGYAIRQIDPRHFVETLLRICYRVDFGSTPKEE
jgi:hypothetical protein